MAADIAMTDQLWVESVVVDTSPAVDVDALRAQSGPIGALIEALDRVPVVDAGLRAWALIDLKNRPVDEVNGPKAAWALALTVVNSAGLLPAAYLVLGRRRG